MSLFFSHCFRSIAWSEEIDMCPDAIYLKITAKNPQDLFPKLRELKRALKVVNQNRQYLLEA